MRREVKYLVRRLIVLSADKTEEYRNCYLRGEEKEGEITDIELQAFDKEKALYIYKDFLAVEKAHCRKIIL